MADCVEYTYLNEDGEEVTGHRIADVRTPEEEAWRTRQALAEADGRKEYTQAELVADHEAGADLPYADVQALSERGGEPVKPAPDEPPPPISPDSAAKAEASALEIKAEDEAAAEDKGRREALEAEKARIDAELSGEGWVK